MSVFYDDRGRDRDYDAPAPDTPGRNRWSAFATPRRPPPRPRREETPSPLLGLPYERAEGVIQLVLAFALVGGATALLYSNLFSGPPAPARVPVAAVSAPTPAPAPAPATVTMAPPTLMSSAPIVASVPPTPPAASPAPVVASQATADAAALFDARPIAGEAEPAPQPLAPPSPAARQKLVAAEETPAAEGAGGEAPASPAPAAANSAEGRLTKCYLKIAGQGHENSDCRIRQLDQKVVFEFANKSLVFAHERGRVWTATMGGRSFGKVYQNAHKPCWGARGSGFFACDNT